MTTVEKTMRGDWRRVDTSQILGPTAKGQYLRRTSAVYDPATHTSRVVFEVLSREQLGDASQELGSEVMSKIRISHMFGRRG